MSVCLVLDLLEWICIHVCFSFRLEVSYFGWNVCTKSSVESEVENCYWCWGCSLRLHQKSANTSVFRFCVHSKIVDIFFTFKAVSPICALSGSFTHFFLFSSFLFSMWSMFATQEEVLITNWGAFSKPGYMYYVISDVTFIKSPQTLSEISWEVPSTEKLSSSQYYVQVFAKL